MYMSAGANRGQKGCQTLELESYVAVGHLIGAICRNSMCS